MKSDMCRYAGVLSFVVFLALSLQLSTVFGQVTFSGSCYNTGPNTYVDVIGGTAASVPEGEVIYLSGSLTISNGAVLNDGGGEIGSYGGSFGLYIGTGTVVVDGTNSTWNSGGISVGGVLPGTTGSLTIQNGGALNSAVASRSFIGSGFEYTPPQAYGSVTVEGPGSIWTMDDSGGGGLIMGNGLLDIENGGEVLVLGGGAGYGSISAQEPASIIVNGAGSRLILGDNGFTCGASGGPNIPGPVTITVENGAYVSCGGASLDLGVSAIVDGSATVWTNNGSLGLSGNGYAGTCALTIQNGAHVSEQNVDVSQGASLTVSGAGSDLNNETNTYNPASGYGSSITVEAASSMNVQNGGSVETYNINESAGATITVDGSGSGIFCGGGINLPSGATLIVRNGGTLTIGKVGIYYTSGTLEGNGIINGNVNVSGEIAPGDGADGIGTLTVNGSLGNSPTYNFAIGTENDQIVVSNNLDLSGTLNIAPLAGVTAGAYTLFTYGGSFQLGSVSIVGPPGFKYTLNTGTAGEVKVVLTSNPPSFTSPSFNSGNITLNGTSGFPNHTFYIIASTNLTRPMSQWAIVATNQFDGVGNFSLNSATNPNTPEQYYSIKLGP